MFRILLSLWFILIIISGHAAAGEYTDTIMIAAGRGESVRINLEWNADNHGTIQWQYSKAGTDWKDIQDATIKYIRLTADSSAYYRAKVTSGECDPVFSSVTYLNVIHIETIAADSITDNQAVIVCLAELTGSQVAEWGIMLDKNPVPDTSSFIVANVPGDMPATFRLQELDPGTRYFTRAFVRLSDGQIALGNIVQFTTVKIEILNRINVTDSSASIWYTISGDTVNPFHGVFISESTFPDTTSERIYGLSDADRFRSDLDGLKPAASYLVLPFVRLYGRYCLGETITMNTCSDYSGIVQDTASFAVSHDIEWSAYATAKKISQPGVYADYGRVRRIRNSDTLLLVYHGGPNNQDWINVYLRRSFDNGNTWQDHKVLANVNQYTNYWRFCNPELLELNNGWLLLAYTANGRPETNENCYLHLLVSKDHGETWEGPVLIQTGRSWEPAMVQLPGGEIELFYSSEARWWPPLPDTYMQQEIHMIRSTDNGKTWSYPITVAWYPGRRDGMPVPLLLKGNRGIAFSIETVNSGTSPYLVDRELSEPWKLTTTNFENSTHRWLAGYFNGHGGGPYLIQIPTGETVLSAHIYRGGDWHQNNYMQVMIGDMDARNFGHLSTPWGVLPANESAVNNSLFLKNTDTIVAISCRNFPDGTGGIYWLEGTIKLID